MWMRVHLVQLGLLQFLASQCMNLMCLMKKCVDKLTYFMKQDLSVNSLMDILSEVKIEEFKPSNKVRQKSIHITSGY